MENQKEYNDLKKDRVHKLRELTDEALSYRYLIEDQATEAITNGDKETLHKTLQIVDLERLLDYLKKDEPEHLLRNFKNQLIIMNTYCRISAKNGGVLPLYLHLTSEQFSLLIEEADSIDYLRDNVYYSIFEEYCNVVSKFSTSTYSAVMTDVVSYITDNLTDDLSLTNVSAKFGMHPVHLARKFKQETGTTFIGYVNQQRIYLSKFYFHIGKYQLSEVATLAGFNSHSYFTKVFKKITGHTPTKYIKQLPVKEKV